MKAFVITLALAGLASTATLDAQIVSSRPVPSTSTSINIDGSWRVVGRDRNGNSIYERRTRDRNGNILVQSAVRDRNGNMQIINSRTEVVNNGQYDNRGRNNNDCSYNQSTNTVGDIIFGRSNNNVDCTDNGTRVDGGWYQVGRGRDNNSIYERRIRDRNGNLVIQRARRNSNGGLTIISSRAYDYNNDKQWKKAQKQREKEIRKAEHDNRGRGNGRD
ncbi:MAG TPA: hypothetical protein VK481_06270 [Gemmatimonadaceae bacterium]|jgi:hypothetical protein|nr:hypothetical protein [Gemmatimonadaceae bacterium]